MPPIYVVAFHTIGFFTYSGILFVNIFFLVRELQGLPHQHYVRYRRCCQMTGTTFSWLPTTLDMLHLLFWQGRIGRDTETTKKDKQFRAFGEPLVDMYVKSCCSFIAQRRTPIGVWSFSFLWLLKYSEQVLFGFRSAFMESFVGKENYRTWVRIFASAIKYCWYLGSTWTDLPLAI